MSKLTNFGENKLVDLLRGVALPLHATNWYIALGSAADDASFTEITGADLPRIAIPHDLVSWAGTQGAGSTLASTGTSHTTSTNIDIQFAAAASNRGSAAVVGLFDAGTGGNCWAFADMPNGAVTVNSGDAPLITAGTLAFALGVTSGVNGGPTDYLVNKLIDYFFRGQAYVAPATLYGCLFTTAPDNAGGGTEVSGGAYARAPLLADTTHMSGTQGPGTTGASSGTSGKSQNNQAVNFPVPSADWGVVVGTGWKDASSGGNLLFRRTLPAAKTVSGGGAAPTWAVNQLAFTLA